MRDIVADTTYITALLCGDTITILLALIVLFAVVLAVRDGLDRVST